MKLISRSKLLTAFAAPKLLSRLVLFYFKVVDPIGTVVQESAVNSSKHEDQMRLVSAVIKIILYAR